jgi:predicted TIM-barrel fold metal-dependent hydrolase
VIPCYLARMTNGDEVSGDAVVVVSADCHAGAPLRGYREYLERKWWDDFDAWSAEFVNPFSDLDEIYADRNWNSAKRLHQLEDDGILAEVIFPNTVPPFYPATGIVAGAPKPEDYDRRWAGLKAHNRWLVDFCADAPGRRAGVFQVMFNDVDDALAEIRWARERGLFGGILLPGIPPGSPIPPIWDSSYETIWAACADLDVPINSHAGGGVPDYGWKIGMARIVYLLEISFYTNRNLWNLIWSGTFERHPGLRYVITEQGFSSVLDQLAKYDAVYAMLKGAGDDHGAVAARELVGDSLKDVPMMPGDYVRRNVWVGASVMGAPDATRRYEFGVERVMWGSDYPHTESSWPDSKSSLATAVADVPEDEARAMLGLNAVEFFGFDLNVLRPLAEKFGPRPSELLGSPK